MRLRATLVLAAGCVLAGSVAACSGSPGATGTSIATGIGPRVRARAIAAIPAEDTSLNTDRIPQSASCSSTADCTVVYPGSKPQIYAVSEIGGAWHGPVPIPGLTGGYDSGLAISCPGAGDCLVGSTREAGGPPVARFATSRQGSWSRAATIPGVVALSGGGMSEVTALSCGGGGWCAVAGEYGKAGSRLYGGAGHPLTPFLATVHDGQWTSAGRVPGLAALNRAGWTATIATVSCGADGWCAAGGSYQDRSGSALEAFVVTGRDGRWGQVRRIASAVPGSAVPGTTFPGGTVPGSTVPGSAGVTEISCTTPGNCSAAGTAGARVAIGGITRAFVVTERNGQWGQPENIPGVSPGATLTAAVSTSLGCRAPGDCVLAGYYAASQDCGGEYNFCYQANFSAVVPFVARQVAGAWQRAGQIPGLAVLSPGIAVVTSVACGSAGFCEAVGFTTGNTADAAVRAFVVMAQGGIWGRARRVPGLVALRAAGSEMDFTSCAGRAGARPGCVAIGSYGIARHPGAQWRRYLFATRG